MDNKEEQYTGKTIEFLQGLDPVKKRPGMFIGGIEDDGLHQMLWEIIDNSIDEYTAGFSTKILVCIEEDVFSVLDDGRGMPFDHNEEFNKNTLELILTMLHSGGKFSDKNYKFSSGLHGVGLSAVNALSSELIIKVKRNKKCVQQKFAYGNPITNLEDSEPIEFNDAKSGTFVQFSPDRNIIKGKINLERVQKKLFQISCLNNNIYIKLIYFGKIFEFKNNKLDSFVMFDRIFTDDIECCLETKNTRLHFLLNYSNDKEQNNYFVNNIHTFNGGTHVNLVKNAITKFFEELIKKNFPKEQIDSIDIKNKMQIIINFQMSEPIFASQTKDRLTSSLTDFQYYNLIQDYLFKYFFENPFLAKQYLELFKSNKKERTTIYNIKENTKKEFVDAASLGGKYQDCSSKNFLEKELFIVEGESAGGTVKQARNRFNQAVLSMRGKFLNAGKHQLNKLFENSEITTLCDVIGIDLNSENLDNLKYNKIIIMTDADHDGAHIVNLHMVLFFTWLQNLIFNGHLYLALPPLYCIRNKIQNLEYCYNETELNNSLNKYKSQKIFIQRFKGLGEMNPEQLKLTTMLPEKRKIIQIKIGDLQKATNVINLVMGTDASFRRDLVMLDKDYVELENLFEMN